MSEKSKFPNGDVVRRLAENVVHGVETAVVTSKDAADLALGVGKDVTDSAIDKGKDAAGFYLRATLRAIDLGSTAIKSIGKQVPLLPEDAKKRLFGDDEPSLGDHPKDNN